MRSGFKRTVGIIMSIVLTAAMLVSCGTSKQSSQNQTQTPEEKVKLTVWYAVSSTTGDAFKALLDKYDAANENVEIESSYSGSYADTATKVSAAMSSNTAPDVALMAAGPLYTGGMGDYFIESKIKDADFKKDDIFAGALDYGKYKGKVCAVPYGISTQVLYYNKNILQKAGIDMSKAPKTWNDLYEMAKLAQKKGNAANSSDFWGFEVSDVAWLFKSMLNQNGNSVINVKDDKITPAYGDDKAIEVATFWKKLTDEKIMPVGQHSNAEKKFLSGNVAFIVSSSNRISKWAAETGVSLGAFPMPYFKKQSLALGGNVLVILGKDQVKKERAWKLVKYLSDANNQTEFALKTGYLPIRKSGLELPVAKQMMKDNPIYEIAFKQLENTWAYVHFEQMGTMDSILVKTIEEIEKNVNSPKDALNNAVKNLEKEMN